VQTRKGNKQHGKDNGLSRNETAEKRHAQTAQKADLGGVSAVGAEDIREGAMSYPGDWFWNPVKAFSVIAIVIVIYYAGGISENRLGLVVGLAAFTPVCISWWLGNRAARKRERAWAAFLESNDNKTTNKE
jgi:hypothetical protein